MRLALITIVVAAAAACSDPTVDIELTFADPMLEATEVTVMVSVIDAESAGATLTPTRVATCDDVAFGLIPPEVLDGARRASAAALGAARLSGIPRLGEKLVVVEARNRNGVRFGAGCEPLHTVDGDTTVTVAVEVAPRVQQLGRMTSDDPHNPAVLATAPWDDAVARADVDVRFELYGTSGSATAAPLAMKTNSEGVAFAAGLPDGGNLGPLQTIVRVKWAEQPVRIAGFNPWERLVDAGGAPIRFASSARLPVDWITGGPVTAGALTVPWAAVALHSRASDDADEVVAIHVDGNDHLVEVAVPVPGVRAIVLWSGHLWTVLSDGWYQLVETGLPADPDIPSTDGRATDLEVVTNCADGDVGLLARRGLGAYVAYSAPGTLAPTESTLAHLATQIGNDRVVGQVCADGPTGGPEKLVLVQTGTTLRAIRIQGSEVVTGRPFFLPLIAAITDFRTGDKRALAGAVATQGGPRAQSFRFGQFTLNGLPFDAAVATVAVDLPLATAPSSLLISDLDGDGHFDALALLPTPNGPRLQAVMGAEVAGQPLAAVADAIATSRGAAQGARLELDQVVDDGDGCLELVVLTDDGLDVFRGKLLDADHVERCPKRAP